MLTKLSGLNLQSATLLVSLIGACYITYNTVQDHTQQITTITTSVNALNQTSIRHDEQIKRIDNSQGKLDTTLTALNQTVNTLNTTVAKLGAVVDSMPKK